MFVILTADELMYYGVAWAGYDRHRQQRAKPSTNIRRFTLKYGSSPIVCAQIWEDLQTTQIPEARVEEQYLDLKYFLAANKWLYRYPIDEEQAAVFGTCSTTVRKWKRFYVQKIAALKGQKVSLLPRRYYNSDY
jgi:hypothetical protein